MRQPIDRQKLLGSEWDCDCGKHHSVPVRLVVVAPKAIEQLPRAVKEESKGKKALVISDSITHRVVGEKAAKLLKANGVSVRELIIPFDKPVADDKTFSWVLTQVKDEDVFISCGSGTITDLTKYAAHKNKKPFIAVATAASMNGYASGIVALTENGIKKTATVSPAVAVIADLDILCAAPMEMTLSGLGDVISKPVCMADWKLASLIKGEPFCKVPYEIIKDLESIYLKDSALIRKRDPKVIGALTEALVFSGVSMVIAGSSSPASGGEHLISHTLDMQADLHGKDHDLHGAQVGVATVVTANLYEEVFATNPQALDWKSIKAKYEAESEMEEIKTYWGPLASEVTKEFEKKLMPWSKKEEELKDIVKRWEEIKTEIKPLLSPSATIKRVLTEAGAKAHYSKLGVSGEDFRQAILMARTMRSRYTILDLASDLNLLEPFAQEMAGKK